MSDIDDRVGRLSAERRALLDLWLGREQQQGAADHVPPRTPVERTLAGIWQQVLDAERIGIDDDYFSAGGDSILAIVVIAKAQAAGLALSTQDLFEVPTIRALAARCVPESPARGPVPEPPPAEPPPAEQPPAEQPPAALPLTPMQEGMLFHALADPSAYVVQVSCRLDGDVDVAELAGALQIVVDRHPELRSCFRVEDAGPRQIVAPSATVPVETADWQGEGSADRLQQYLADDRRRGMDPAAAPLLRAAFFRLAPTRYHCVLTHHHLLLDGWSQQLVLRELLEVYDGRGGEAPARPRLPFADHLDWLARQDLAAAEEFWRRELDGCSPTLVGGSGTGGPYGLLVRETAGDGLAEFGRRHGVTLSTLVQGGWALLLSQLCGEEDVVLGVTVSGRPAELAGVTEALGMFINTLPSRVRVGARQEPPAWLRSLQRHQAELQRYHYTPLNLAERCSGREPGTRLFDSIVVVENFPVVIGDRHTTRRLRISEAAAFVEEGYPLVLEVRPEPSSPAPGPRLRLRLRYDRHRIGDDRANALLDAFEDYAAAVTRSADVGEVRARLGRILAERGRSDLARRLREARRQPHGGGDP